MKDPLPATVVADSNVKVAAAVQVSTAANDEHNQAVAESVKAIQQNTGKRVVLVVRVHTADDAENTLVWRWIAAVPGQDFNPFPNRDAAANWAFAYVASQAVPSGWVVIG